MFPLTSLWSSNRPATTTESKAKKLIFKRRKIMENQTRKSQWEVLKNNDQLAFLSVGLLFLVTAVVLTIREMDLGLGYAIAALSAVAATVSYASKIRALRIGGFVLAFMGAVVSSATYAFLQGYLIQDYLWAPLVILVASIAWVIRLEGKSSPTKIYIGDPGMLRLVWSGLAFSLVIVSWLFYFQYVTHGLTPEFHLRRLILTGFWMITGLALYLGGRNKEHKGMMTCGMLLTMMASGKAVFYDTSHLEGFDRIITLASMGIGLVGASLYLRKRFSAKRNHTVNDEERSHV
jgi:hypothetical protein